MIKLACQKNESMFLKKDQNMNYPSKHWMK